MTRLKVRTVTYRQILVTVWASLLAAASGFAKEDRTTPATVPPAPVTAAAASESFPDINERLSRTVTPETNCVVPFIEVMGANFLSSSLRAETLRRLGLDEETGRVPQLLYPEAYVQQTVRGSPQEQEAAGLELYRDLQLAANGPWSAAEFPQVAAYLTANRQALDRLRDAVERPRYYAPVLSDDAPPRLLSASWAIERQLGLAARLLTVRALLAAKEGKFDQATGDLMSVHQWAVKLAKGSPFDLSVAKAQVLDSLACHATLSMTAAGLWTADAARKHRLQLRSAGELPPAWQSVEFGERGIVHEEIALLKSDPASVAGFFELPAETGKPAPREITLKKVRWKLADAAADKIFDEIVQALKIDGHAEQEQAFVAIDAAAAEWKKDDVSFSKEFPRELREDADKASRWIGQSMAMSLLPNYRQRRFSQDRAKSRRQLVEVSLALWSAYLQDGMFPAELKDLVPSHLSQLPVDAHSEKPLVYERKSDDVVRFGTLGHNQQSDDGSLYNDDLLLELRKSRDDTTNEHGDR